MARRRKQKITPRALMELKMPGEVQVAPDSLRIAYGVSETEWDDNSVTQHLWVLKIGSDAEPRQLTRGAGSEAQPRWSPDGSWLAFLSSRDDEGGTDYDADAEPKEQVWLLPMDGLGGEAQKLTDAPEGVGDYDWLPDSSGVVYLSQEPRPKPLEEHHANKKERKDDAVVERYEKFRQQIWRIDRESKKPKLIHPGDFGVGEISASPDGKSVAFTTNYTGEVNDYHKSDVWVVDIESGASHPVADGPGGKFHPVWTRDSSQVLYVASLDPDLSYSQPNLYAASVLERREPVHLTADFPHDLTGWHGVTIDAAGLIYVLAAVGTTTAVFRWDGAVWSAVVQNDEHLHDYHVAPNGGVAYVSSSTVDVPELCWLAPNKTRPETLTDLNQDWGDGYVLAPTQLVSWKSPDGLEIEGLLTVPPNYQNAQDSPRLPMIVSLHGGPHGRTVQALSPYTACQVWAAEGYAVLSPNYRGSEGYGSEFSTANRHDLGGGDAADILAGIDQAVGEGIVDPDRLAVIGSSYGGYLVNWLIGTTKRFQAAVSQFGIFSLTTDFSNSQAPRWETEYLGGYPWDKPELYAERSPATYLKDIETPVLLMHGDLDPNTFIANSQEMYQALHLLGKTVEYVHYPREGHGFGEPQHRLDELRRTLNWFDKYLNGGANTVHRTGDKLLQDGWELIVTSAVLETYSGHIEGGPRYVEIALALRDTTETCRPLTLKPADFTLTRTVPPGRPTRPIGLPVSVLEQKALAEGTNWSFTYAPEKDARALTAPLALTFRLPATGGTYQFKALGFPPITLEVPALEKTDEEKKDEKTGKEK